MKRTFTLHIGLFIYTLFFGQQIVMAQDKPVHPSVVKTGTFLGETPALRDLPALTSDQMKDLDRKALKKAKHMENEGARQYPYATTALPKGPDSVWQKTMGRTQQTSKTPLVNFEGQTTSSFPPDCNGTIGPNHFMQVVNLTYAIYNRTGTLVAGPTALNTLFTGVAGANYNDGDPIVLYDDQADRWMVAEFTYNHSNDYMLVAVSSTNDPTGTWYKYSFDVVEQPDYPKFGIWPDGYYLGINNSTGNDIYVFERAKMLLGQTAQMLAFDNPYRPSSPDGFMCVPPVDNDGVAAPAGAPGTFIAFNDDAVGGGYDQLWLYELAANWTMPASSTFARTQQLNVAPFKSQFDPAGQWNDISQPTTMKLDAVPQVIMNVPQYRNFGTYQTLVCCHSVDVDNTQHAGIRWYELRRGTQTSGNWTVRQQGTYAPDANSRWMGSIMLNSNGRLGLGYSVSSSTVYPSIRYSGQSAGAYAAASGTMDIAEQTIFSGTVAQSGYNRWGDYSLMSVDPSDNQTFWFTSEYLKTASSKGTKIASFKILSVPTVATLAASGTTTTTTTLNGTVNPNGIATNYYFQWGTTVSYGNTTATTSAGSGTSSVAVSANLTGLTSGLTYHFRIVGTNNDGTTYGDDLTFTTTCPAISTFPWNEGFENAGAIPNCWSQEYVVAPNVNWVFITGNGSNYPLTAHSGTYNACFKDNTKAANKTKLITPPLNLSGISNPALTFWHTQYNWSSDQDSLVVYYKTSAAGTWVPLASYPSAITAWTQESIALPNPTGNYYIAFEGNAKYGRGVCIDDVKVDCMPMPVSLTIAASANPSCMGANVTFTATPTNGGTTPVYQWIKNGSNVGTNSATYSYTSANNDVITCVLTSNAACATGSPATSNAVTMTVNAVLPVSVYISPSGNNVCAGTAVTYTATPTNGGTTPSYQWKVNGSNVGTNASTYAYTPANNDAVSCVMTSNASCISGNPATSNTVTMTVNPSPPASVSISPSGNNVCAGASVTYTATPTNGGTTPVYQWKVNGSNVGTNATTYSYSPANSDAITCVMTSNALCASGSPATSNSVSMVVNPLLPASIAISPSANPVCAGTSATFTATPTNGGTTPVYQWKKNGSNVGTNAATYAYTPAINDAITCVMTSNATCATGSPATSNAVTMVVNPLITASVAISPTATNVCAGTSVTYTATPTNGGTTPVYQWKKNGSNVGTNAATYAYTPANNDAITCLMTSNATCITGSPAASNTVTMTVNALLPASVSISPTATNVCSGASVTFTATPTNGGTTPVYQWKKNGSNVGTNATTYTYTPANNDAITCVMTSNATCASGSPATSNAVTMTVNSPLPVSVAVSPSANPVCAGASVTFTAVPTNGGTTPIYQWKKNSSIVGTNAATYSYTPANSDAITCVMTSNATCITGSPATSNAVTMTVNALLPASVAISPSGNNVCSGTTVTFTATPTNGGTTPVYQWKKNGSIVGTNAITYSYIPANSDAITCVLTSNAACATGSPATSNAVTMTVNALLPVSVAISASANPACSGASVTFTAAAVNGGTSPTYQWKKNGINVGTSAATYSYISASGDVIFCEMTSNAVCGVGIPATSNSVTMTVNAPLPASVSIAATGSSFCSGTTVALSATPTNGGTAPAYQWKRNGNNVGTGTASYTYIPTGYDAISCVMTSNGCASGNPATSNTVYMAPDPVLPVSVTVSTTANPVVSGTSATFTATITNGGTTPVYQWKKNNINVGTNSATYTYVPANNDVITCVLTSNALCAAGTPATSNAVTMTVYAAPLTVSPSNQTVGSAAGNAAFAVTTNLSWTASSNQAWCTVTPSGSGSGSLKATYTQNSSGAQRVANITVLASGVSPIVVTVTQVTYPSKQLNLTVLLEGLFNGTTMNQAKNATGNQYASSVADDITVELHNSTSPYALAGGPFTVDMNMDGTAAVTAPVSLGASYYVVVKHRNSIETWSAAPLSFAGTTMSYNFTTAAGQAYSNNLKLVSGKYVIYAGDVNQDGMVDSYDQIATDNYAASFMKGYVDCDVNGDGKVDSGDLIMLTNNANVFVSKKTP